MGFIADTEFLKSYDIRNSMFAIKHIEGLQHKSSVKLKTDKA